MRRIRLFLGIFLILLSIGSLLFWEMKGRDVILLDQVLVAKEDIAAGIPLTRSMFMEIGVPRENLVAGALKEVDLEELSGRTSTHHIVKNSQLTWASAREKDFSLQKGESIFVLHPQWISMRSSALRSGDWVDLYNKDGSQKIGTYKVAFVKDSSEREVKDMGLMGETKWEDNWLERKDATSLISHVEVITTLADYTAILQAVNGEEAGTLMIVQKGAPID